MAYEKREQLYEGKAKKVYATDDPEVVIVSYKDDATAFNGLKKGTITGKGAINNRMTNNLMRRLEEKGAVRTVELSRAKVYYPAIEREDAAMSETTDLIDRVYRGSLSQLVSTFTKKQALPKEEIDELYAMLKRMEGEINA